MTDAAPIPAQASPSAPDPRDRATLIAWIRLLRSPRVGPATFRRLIAAHGSADGALTALPEVARAAGVARYTPFTTAAAEAEVARATAAGAVPLMLGAPDYPPHLAEIDDAPPLLWARGDPGLAARPTVAIVGARNASALGVRMAAHLARGLSAGGYVVVSGLARGIDTTAHAAALDGGTVAVLAGGVDVIYPRENADLADRIAAHGLILSEMAPGLQPQARHFPRRNRIISGLCPGLIVVEGAAKSGSLITAKTAADQGREVMAVPGHPFDARAAGCNALLRDGAVLVRGPEDAIDAMKTPETRRPAPVEPLPLPVPAPPIAAAPPGALNQAILSALGPTPISEDALIRQLRRPAAEVLAALAELDLAGVLERHHGAQVSRLAG